MNKKFIKTAFAVAIAMIAGVNVFNAQKSVVLSDVAMANVEALARGEVGTGDKTIVDTIVEQELLGNGCVRTTYNRKCAYGGSSSCERGTYQDVICL